jgi:hypothetical protein
MERLDRIEKNMDAFFKGMEELRISQKETAAQMKETDKRIEKSDARLERLGVLAGNTAKNIGFVTEDYFYNALADKMEFGGIKYDQISKNIHVKTKKLEDEFDIVMYNGNSIAIIESKFKAHKNDINTLMQKKAKNFRILHPDFAKYKIYLGIASFGFYNDLEQYAKENGIGVLKQKGEVTEIEDDNLKVY